MTFDDAIQIATLASVAIALILSLLQNRQILRQTRELAKQSSMLVETIEYSSYQATVAGDVSLSNLAAESPELLRWHPAARGYSVGSNAANRKVLFAIVRLNAHEGNFLAHDTGRLNDDIWIPWSRVLETDMTIAEYRAVWPNARNFFAASFVSYVDSVIAGQTDSAMSNPDQNGIMLPLRQISAPIHRITRTGPGVA
jgi:hypothetical protein